MKALSVHLRAGIRQHGLAFFLFSFAVLGLTILSGNHITRTFNYYYQINNHGVLATIILSNALLCLFLYCLIRVNIFFAIVLALVLSLNFVSYQTFGTILTFEVISLSIREIDQAASFCESYLSSAFLLPVAGFFIASVLLYKLTIHKKPQNARPAMKWGVCVMLVAASLALGYFLEKRTASSFMSYIDPFRTISKTAYALNHNILYTRRATLDLFPQHPAMAHHIVLLIDESVAYDHLGFAGYNRDTTPYLSSISSEYRSMGRSLSSFNCSGPSNFVLTADVKVDDIPDYQGRHTLSKPSLFAYAKNAGYKTAYLSAQKSAGQFQNYMSLYDLEKIDLFHNDNSNAMYNDFALIEVMRQFMLDNEKTFTVVVKSGSHFPWTSQKYGEVVFDPVLPDGEALDIDKKDLVINSYDNLVHWNTDKFMSAFMPHARSHNALVIYTSDHGQNIFHNEDVPATHCTFTGEPPPEQAFVPLLVFGTEGVKNIEEGDGFYSHFHIPPTIKHAMGYEVDLDETLFSDAPRKLDFFFTGNIFHIVRKIPVDPRLRKS